MGYLRSETRSNAYRTFLKATVGSVFGGVRSAVETVFAAQKHRFGLFVRTIGLTRARTKIGLANLAYNLKRFLWIKAQPVAA